MYFPQVTDSNPDGKHASLPPGVQQTKIIRGGTVFEGPPSEFDSERRIVNSTQTSFPSRLKPDVNRSEAYEGMSKSQQMIPENRSRSQSIARADQPSHMRGVRLKPLPQKVDLNSTRELILPEDLVVG